MMDWFKCKLNKIGTIKMRKVTLQKNELLMCFHILVSIIVIGSFLTAIFLIFTASDEVLQNEFINYGLRNFPFLFSLWVMFTQQISLNMYAVLDIAHIFSIGITKEKKDYLHSIASYLLYSMSFPLSVTVGIVFWGLYFYNKDQLYPEILENLLPPKLNHICHTLPPMMTLFYMVSSSKFIPSKSSTRRGLFAFLIIYGTCLVFLKMATGKYVYLAFEALTPLQMKLLLLFCFVASFVFLEIGYTLTEFIQGLSNRGVFKAFDVGLQIWIPVL